MTLKELTERATERPWHTDGDGQIFGPNPEFDPTDLQTHDEILIADVAPEGMALTEYDADNAAMIVHCVNNFTSLMEALTDCAAALQPSRNQEEREALAKACVALAMAKEVK